MTDFARHFIVVIANASNSRIVSFSRRRSSSLIVRRHHPSLRAHEAIQDMFDNNYIHHLLQRYLHRLNPGLPRLWARNDKNKRRHCEGRSNPGYYPITENLVLGGLSFRWISFILRTLGFNVQSMYVLDR